MPMHGEVPISVRHVRFAFVPHERPKMINLCLGHYGDRRARCADEGNKSPAELSVTSLNFPDFLGTVWTGTLIIPARRWRGGPSSARDRSSEFCRKFNLGLCNDQARYRFKHICLRCRKVGTKALTLVTGKRLCMVEAPSGSKYPRYLRASSTNTQLKPRFSVLLPQHPNRLPHFRCLLPSSIILRPLSPYAYLFRVAPPINIASMRCSLITPIGGLLTPLSKGSARGVLATCRQRSAYVPPYAVLPRAAALACSLCAGTV
jgi:hypothetical protein